MTRRGGVIWTIAAIFLVYSGICLAMFAFQRSLQYRPETGALTPGDWGLPDFRVVTVTAADGAPVDLWYAAAAGLTKPTVVLFHGNGGHMGHRADKARALVEQGYGVLLAGYRGYGPNPGSPTEEGLYMDGRAALDFLVREGVSGGRVALWGESLGTGVAVQLATERKVAAVILEAPYTSIPDAAAAHYPWLPVQLLVRDRFDSLRKIADVQGPVLVVHGEADTVVPVALGRRLFDAAPEPKAAAWVPGAGHMDLPAHGLYRIVLDFLHRQGRGAEAPVIDQPRQPGRSLATRP